MVTPCRPCHQQVRAQPGQGDFGRVLPGQTAACRPWPGRLRPLLAVSPVRAGLRFQEMKMILLAAFHREELSERSRSSRLKIQALYSSENPRGEGEGNQEGQELGSHRGNCQRKASGHGSWPGQGQSYLPQPSCSPQVDSDSSASLGFAAGEESAVQVFLQPKGTEGDPWEGVASKTPETTFGPTGLQTGAPKVAWIQSHRTWFLKRARHSPGVWALLRLIPQKAKSH